MYHGFDDGEQWKRDGEEEENIGPLGPRPDEIGRYEIVQNIRDPRDPKGREECTIRHDTASGNTWILTAEGWALVKEMSIPEHPETGE